MNPSFEEAFDFDLFTHPAQNAVPDIKLDKLRKAVLIAKKKTIATDLLIRKHLEKKEILEQTELMLFTAKEECKRVCIDYKNTLEKCTGLEKDIQNLKDNYGVLELQLTFSKNQYEAMKSHANQLQSLVKENEFKIEALQVEKQFIEKKKEKDSVDVSEKKVISLKKQNETLLSHILLLKDIVLGKKKLQKQHKVLLRKYKKSEQETNDECHDGDYSSDGTDYFDDCVPPTSDESFEKPLQNQDSQTKTENVFKENINDPCTTNGINGVQESEHDSEDTGRGSSLAFSDGGKFFNSPDYYSHDSSHIESESNKVDANRKFADASTSTFYNVEEKATSPLIFDDVALLSENIGIQTNRSSTNSPEYFITDMPLSTEVVTIKEKIKLVDCATSPIQDVERIHVASSPIEFLTNDLLDVNTDSIKNKNSINPLNNVDTQDFSNHSQNIVKEHNSKTNIGNKTNQETSLATDILQHGAQEISSIDLTHAEIEICDKNVLEKICLEKNNSNNLTDKCDSDTEIEMILSSMRLDHRLLTPIPHTPSKSRDKNKRALISSQQHQCIDCNHTHCASCTETLKLREESKVLHKKVAILSKDILHIKSSLHTLNILPFADSNNEEFHLRNVLESNNKNKVTENVKELDKHTVRDLDETVDKESFQLQNPIDKVCALNTDEIDLFNKSKCLQINDEENLPLSNFVDKDFSKPNNFRSKITFEEDASNNTDMNLYKNIDNINKESNGKKRKTNQHNKKLSKLEKLRHKMLPKYKIEENKVSNNIISRKKLKPIVVIRNKEELDKMLSNKLAYEKAVKIMAESKTKNNDALTKSKIVKNDKRKHVNNENDIEKPTNNFEINLRTNRKETEENILSERNQEKNKELEPEKREKIGLEKNETEKTTLGDKCDNTFTLARSNRTTRSRSKLFDQSETCTVLSPKKLDNNSNRVIVNQNTDIMHSNDTLNSEEKLSESRKRLKRAADEVAEVTCKRILRSSKVKELTNATNTTIDDNVNKGSTNISNSNNINSSISTEMNLRKRLVSQNERDKNETNRKQSIEYSDLDLFSTTEKYNNSDNNDSQSKLSDYPKNSILCKMIDKYGKKSAQFSCSKVTEQVSNSICNKLEEDIANIIELPANKSKQGMDKLVEDIQKLNVKSFIIGFVKYLKKPARKQEMYKTINTPPAPPMTKAEQILLYIVKQLKNQNSDIINIVLTNIEYTLFQLNRTPEFDTVESMSHFYALVCRYFRLKNRLRLFLLDAMYCLSFKVVTVVKQCLDVWMHILPLAHMGIAKSPLVTCLVYLLHFYKCEDRFKRVEGIRYILHQKYFYRITEWSEVKVLEMFKNAVKEIRDVVVEKKILRIALIILAKRQGAAWCQKNIIKNMLLPIIEKERASNVSKQFAVSMLGPLLKPYPMDMKVHCEIIVNQLLDMLDQNPSDSMKEAIFTSLIYMNKHNQYRVTQALLVWEPKQVSIEFEELIKDFVREKPVKTWTKILPKMLYHQC